MPTEELPAHVEALLEEVLDRSPAERQRILDARRAEDAAACARVEALLADDRPAFLDHLAAVPPLEEWFEHDPPLKPGVLLPDLRLEEEIGRGGMAVVYKARQLSLDRVVAVKVLLAGPFAAPAAVRRFRAEAEAVGRLQHPNIVQIHVVGEHEGLPFLCLEYVAGGSLAERLKGEPLPPPHAARLAETLARAVQHAHERGIVHLDLKPANILLSFSRDPEGSAAAALPSGSRLNDAHPKVADFGLARRWEEGGAAATQSGTIRGTPSYMAPEQAASRTGAIGPCSDVYALGAILYELLTGRPPFRATTPLETLEQVRTQEPVSPRQLQPAVPRDLETVCRKCLEKDPRRRYPTAAALAADLRRFLDGRPVLARPAGRFGRGWRWCRRRPLVASLIAALLLVVASGLPAVVVLWRQKAREATRAQAGEAEALANLQKEQTARREVEEHRAKLREIVLNSAHRTSLSVFHRSEDNPFREAMLDDAASHLTGFLRRGDDGPQVRLLLAHVLTQRGRLLLAQSRWADAQASLEQAAHLWEGLSADADHRWAARVNLLFTGAGLMRIHEQQGREGLAQQSFEATVRTWQGLIREAPEMPHLSYCTFVKSLLDVRELFLDPSPSVREMPGRLEKIRGRLARGGGGPESDLFFDLLRVTTWCAQAERQAQDGDAAALRASAREAAATLTRLLGQPSLHRQSRCHVALAALDVSVLLRRAELPAEALRLSGQANRTLRAAAQEAPDDPHALVGLSRCWCEIGKCHRKLDQEEAALTACRNAIAAAWQLLALRPAEPAFRQLLGQRHLQLGRKQCALGRLDEAEAAFRERQALWPGDAVKQGEALRELRKWAAETEEHKEALSPEGRLERQRYLDLCARLEGKSMRAASE